MYGRPQEEEAIIYHQRPNTRPTKRSFKIKQCDDSTCFPEIKQLNLDRETHIDANGH